MGVVSKRVCDVDFDDCTRSIVISYYIIYYIFIRKTIIFVRHELVDLVNEANFAFYVGRLSTLALSIYCCHSYYKYVNKNQVDLI